MEKMTRKVTYYILKDDTVSKGRTWAEGRKSSLMWETEYYQEN